MSCSSIPPEPIDAMDVDPMLRQFFSLLSDEDLVATINYLSSILPYYDAPAVIPELIPNDGSTQICGSLPSSPSHSPQNYPPGHDHVDTPFTATISTSSPSTNSSSESSGTRMVTRARCEGARPERVGERYGCSSCGQTFARRDGVKRHIRQAGTKIACRYCDGLLNRRPHGLKRHLDDHQDCNKIWKEGYKDGRFTERTVEDPFYS